MRKLNLIAAVTVGSISVSALALAVVTVASAPAQATPAYAAQEKKACGFCHVNAAGGGPRNAAGKKYEANGHKF
jgi:mono/diheme cytochrome c family protein